MTYWIRNVTGIKDDNLPMVDEAVRLGSDGWQKRMHGRWYRVVQTEPMAVYDFGPGRNVKIKVPHGKYPYRAPQDGDWYVKFTNNTWRLFTDEAYNRYLYLLERKINEIMNQTK